MRNQFFFTRTEGDKTFRDSFNINKVIRSVQVDDNTLIVLLDDLHERVKEVPNINTHSNKVIGDDEVVQEGENGLERITQRVKYVNVSV